MRNYSILFLAVMLFTVGCAKDDQAEVSSEGKITGKINGVDIGEAVVTSDVEASGTSEVMYIVAKTNFESFSTPTTNGKQLLVRIQPYTGVGTYNAASQGFWAYSENITVVSSSKASWKLHRYSDKETKGSMNLVITSDKTENGKRVIRGKFSGESGITFQTTDYDQKEVPLETFKLTDVNFVAPEKE